MDTPARKPVFVRGARRAPWLLAWLLVVACANLVPVHGWDPGAGPVVPHDSFPGDCSLCHTGTDWHTLRADFAFDHAARTGVPLQGAHAQASCLHCHNDRGPVATFAARGCGGCHADPHLLRLGTNCQDCHDERTWYPREAILLHDRTRFPLVGAHAAAACFRCHPGATVGNFAGAPAECVVCHEADYLRTNDPSHVQAAFARTCEQCHMPVAWSMARFDHPASFPLTFGHAGRSCRACHTTPNVFTGLSTACANCHLDDYQRTSDPPHGPANFSTDCTLCHTTITWQQGAFAHVASFPLTFGHAGRRCADCHQGGVYTGLPAACSACHLDDYQRTTTPNHGTAGFSTECAGCHTTVTWQGANLVHPASFPLTNAHNRACSACHQGGVYTGLNPGCASCHLADWQQSTNPPHAAFGLSQQCQQCHGTTTWGTGSWQHQFPIQGGPHGGLACFDCHNNPANRPAFSCIDCHEHRQSEANAEHQGVAGYVWATANCYQCHPTGSH